MYRLLLLLSWFAAVVVVAAFATIVVLFVFTVLLLYVPVLHANVSGVFVHVCRYLMSVTLSVYGGCTCVWVDVCVHVCMHE